jgi:hypothetical protein
VNRCFAATRSGHCCTEVEPSPRAPFWPSPQHHAVPSGSSAQLCVWPALMVSNRATLGAAHTSVDRVPHRGPESPRGARVSTIRRAVSGQDGSLSVVEWKPSRRVHNEHASDCSSCNWKRPFSSASTDRSEAVAVTTANGIPFPALSTTMPRIALPCAVVIAGERSARKAMRVRR